MRCRSRCCSFTLLRADVQHRHRGAECRHLLKNRFSIGEACVKSISEKEAAGASLADEQRQAQERHGLERTDWRHACGDTRRYNFHINRCTGGASSPTFRCREEILQLCCSTLVWCRNKGQCVLETRCLRVLTAFQCMGICFSPLRRIQFYPCKRVRGAIGKSVSHVNREP